MGLVVCETVGEGKIHRESVVVLHLEAWHLQEVLLTKFYWQFFLQGRGMPMSLLSTKCFQQGEWARFCDSVFFVFFSFGILLMACEFPAAKAKILFLGHEELWILFYLRSLYDVKEVTFHRLSPLLTNAHDKAHLHGGTFYEYKWRWMLKALWKLRHHRKLVAEPHRGRALCRQGLIFHHHWGHSASHCGHVKYSKEYSKEKGKPMPMCKLSCPAVSLRRQTVSWRAL